MCLCEGSHLNIPGIILPFDKRSWNHRGVLTGTNRPFIPKPLNYLFSFVCVNSACLQIGLACNSEPNFSSVEVVVEVAVMESQPYAEWKVLKGFHCQAKLFVCCFVVNALQPSFSTGCSFKRDGEKRETGHGMSASGYRLPLSRKVTLSPPTKGCFKSLQMLE